MIRVHIRDALGIYSHSTDVDPLGPMPLHSTTTAPPKLTGSQVASWTGKEWLVLAERPAPAPAAAIVPESVTRRQGRQALFLDGHLSTVSELIAAMPSPQREMAEIEWQDATEFMRNSPLVALMGAGLGLDSSQLDELFIKAAAL